MKTRDLLQEPHSLREISVEGMVAVSTIKRYLRGEPVRSTSRARIERAMAIIAIKHAQQLAWAKR